MVGNEIGGSSLSTTPLLPPLRPTESTSIRAATPIPQVYAGSLARAMAFLRAPGNELAFWIRKTLRWSRGEPQLIQESKEGLFSYLPPSKREWAEAKEESFRNRYDLQPLADKSSQLLYRKNLYLLDALEKATEMLPLPPMGKIKAMDVGSQDWHYAFALERFLSLRDAKKPRQVSLEGVEVDGYGIYRNFHSRLDYAKAYSRQTGNPMVKYQVIDFLKVTPKTGGLDILTCFFPFIFRYGLLLWGLPLRFFAPVKLLQKALELLKPGGYFVIFTHTSKEHHGLIHFLRGEAAGSFDILSEGPFQSCLVDFYASVADRHFILLRKPN